MSVKSWILSSVVVCTMTVSPLAQSFSIVQPKDSVALSQVALLQVKATKGNAEAQFLLGLMYLSGRFVAQSQPEGIDWLTKAAKQDHVKAQKMLADLAFEGNIIPRDLLMAKQWYTVLSEQGNKWADFRLGFIYASGGTGVERNCGKAVKQFKAVGDSASLANVAWILATCPEAKYRDGSQALALSLSLLEVDAEDPVHLDNLAAAYAENGNFIAAINTQKKAIEALALMPELNKSEAFKSRLESYQNLEPYREVIELILH